MDINGKFAGMDVESVKSEEGPHPYIALVVLGNLSHIVAAYMVLHTCVNIVKHGIVVLLLSRIIVYIIMCAAALWRYAVATLVARRYPYISFRVLVDIFYVSSFD